MDESRKTIEMLKGVPMVFIVGLGRSGSTLLQELMNAHPDVLAPPEYSFIIYMYPRFGHKNHWTQNDILDFIEALYFRPVFSLWFINKQELTEQLLSVREYADYPLLCKMVFYQMAKEKKNPILFCDKNPENSLFIKTLLKVFPDAKFIHLVRDPRDNINSQNKSFKRKNIYFISRRWIGYNRAVEKIKQKMPERIHTLCYEDLVTTTEQTMRAICEFLPIPYSPLMTENGFQKKLPSIEKLRFAKRVKHMHKSLMSPVNSSNIGKWKEEMSPQNIAIVQSLTGALASTYGYEISKEKTKEEISHIKVIQSWLRYTIWELFTKLRYKNYVLNRKYYSRKMKYRPLGV